MSEVNTLNFKDNDSLKCVNCALGCLIVMFFLDKQTLKYITDPTSPPKGDFTVSNGETSCCYYHGQRQGTRGANVPTRIFCYDILISYYTPPNYSLIPLNYD
ncbi:hypothetical protein U1Q18_052417 [Sarracenia purpurea var. burkii]